MFATYDHLDSDSNDENDDFEPQLPKSLKKTSERIMSVSQNRESQSKTIAPVSSFNDSAGASPSTKSPMKLIMEQPVSGTTGSTGFCLPVASLRTRKTRMADHAYNSVSLQSGNSATSRHRETSSVERSSMQGNRGSGKTGLHLKPASHCQNLRVFNERSKTTGRQRKVFHFAANKFRSKGSQHEVQATLPYLGDNGHDSIRNAAVSLAHCTTLGKRFLSTLKSNNFSSRAVPPGLQSVSGAQRQQNSSRLAHPKTVSSVVPARKSVMNGGLDYFAPKEKQINSSVLKARPKYITPLNFDVRKASMPKIKGSPSQKMRSSSTKRQKLNKRPKLMKILNKDRVANR